MAKTQYEGLFLFPGNAEVDTSLNRVRSIIESHGGKIIVLKKWDERKLAYEIKKHKRGLYILAFYTAPNTANALITRDVNLSDDILRVLITDASHLSKEEMERVEPQPSAPIPSSEKPDLGFVPRERSSRRRDEDMINA